ncbi:hypothetical protein SAMN05421853_1069 [Roseivivax halotolerans]|uniref:Uncharacterized protein n=2 Tax=Roseivivax halotolerans TaxID=93684 RepID=A0A1I5YJZ5_9RHOB|nr:hypothetical protein SAMN05421853_1069 [Roseivivax halotolerans]
MWFDIYGPFDLARIDMKIPSQQPDFWEQVQEASARYDYESQGLERAIGCYAFGLRHGDAMKPWYIGMTVAKGGFRREVLEKHKRDHYDAVIREHRGTPILFLMPLLTPEGYFSRNRKSAKPLIQWVEKMLFGVALRQNPECRNQRDTKYLRNVVVHGIFNSRPVGQQGPEVTAARRMFGET